MRNVLKSTILTAIGGCLLMALPMPAIGAANPETDQSFAAAAMGGVFGPVFDCDRLPARSVVTYTILFRAGELAEVFVSGDGDTDLDLRIYDESGNLIDEDTGLSDDCHAAWTPRWTGEFTVQIVNLGSVYNEYCMSTN
jgi:hypothetical protein